MRRTLVIQIDCHEIFCGDCDHLEPRRVGIPGYCRLWDASVGKTERQYHRRLEECKIAEVESHVGNKRELLQVRPL